MQIDLQDVYKTYDGRRWVVRDLSFSVHPGRVVGLIGPNGAGKSTTLRMLATQMAPSRGAIRYDGAEPRPDTLPSIRRRIGFLGDGHALYRDMSPREYLAFFARCLGLAPAQRRAAVDEVLAMFSLTEKADTPAGALSKGMRQRLALARCFLHEPEALLVDEPADGLDPRGRMELRRILRAAADGGAAVVISSHILRELDGLCDDAVILRDGRAQRLPLDGRREGTAPRALRFELRTTAGASPRTVAAVAARHGALIEGARATRDGHRFDLLWRRSETDLAAFVADLVHAGAGVCGLERTRTDIEALYDVVSDDRVS